METKRTDAKSEEREKIQFTFVCATKDQRKKTKEKWLM
jgi:hypothetical protein